MCDRNRAKTPNHFWQKQSSLQVYCKQTSDKFETTGSVLTVKSPGRKRSRRTEERLVLVQDNVIASSGKSIRRRSQ